MFKLHTKILMMMCLAMGFLLMTTFLYLLAHKKEAERFNIAYRENATLSIHNYIRMKEQDLMKTTFDYSVWDEMVNFIHNPSPKWASENLNTILTTLNCAFIALYDEHFHLVYISYDTLKFPKGSFGLSVDPLKLTFTGTNTCHYYTLQDASLIEIAGSAVVPSLDIKRTSKPHGYLITGRKWDSIYVKELRNVTNASLEMIPLDRIKNNPAGRNVNQEDNIVIQQFLKDYQNRDLIRLDFISKTQYNQNQNFFFYFTLVPFLITVILGFLFYLLVRSWITVPLNLLTESLDSNDPAPLGRISSRNREFHAFGRMMQSFFDNKIRLEKILSEHKVAEDRILKLSTALDQSSAVIVITDIKGKIDYVSRQFFDHTGYTRQEALGRNPRILNSGHHPKVFYQELWDTILAGRVWRGEFLNRKKNGELFWESASITPIKNLEGEIINFIAVKEDITERKAAREKLALYAEELKESNSSKDKFFSILAHDLKSPFHSILGYSELLASEYDTLSDADRRKFIQILRNSTKNVYDLVENLLQWSRLQTGKIVFSPGMLDIAREVEYSVDIFRAIGLRKNIKLDISIPSGSRVFADKNMVRSILQNLISNALKFTSGNGTIKIRTVLKDREYEILISDTGIGMEESDLLKLFRIDISFTRKGTALESGTGLGLLLCKELVEKNGGKIWAESQVNTGSVFHFTLPAFMEQG